MAQNLSETDLRAIENAVRKHPDGASASEISEALGTDLPRRTLQYRLKHLVDAGRLTRNGSGRWARYHAPAGTSAEAISVGTGRNGDEEQVSIPLSAPGVEIREYLAQPPAARKPVGYNRDFLKSYQPNATTYLSEDERAHLQEVGRPNFAEQPAGTYARHILDRLLIDLSWNSSRLEGNTYSLLDTRRLIQFGEEAEGRAHLEAQMILNHKDAIAFLVDAAEEIGFNRYTILNLHGFLAQNLLPDESAAGRLRHIPIGIEKSVFHPLEVPQLSTIRRSSLARSRAAVTLQAGHSPILTEICRRPSWHSNRKTLVPLG